MRHYILAVTVTAVVPFSANAITISPGDDPDVLANATLATNSGITIVSSSPSLIGDENQQGTFTALGGTINGTYLTTGLGDFSTTENTVNNASGFSSQGPYQPLVDLASDGGLNTNQADSNVLSFDFVLEDPSQNAVSLQFAFATDEFPTQSVTDIMGIFVNGVNYAFFPNGDLVSNQSGDPNSFFNETPVGDPGIEWNGITNIFTLVGLANGDGATNTIDFAIADTSDQIFDSAVFFGNMQGTTTQGAGGIEDPNVIPLPAGVWLLLSGLAGLGFMRRRSAA